MWTNRQLDVDTGSKGRAIVAPVATQAKKAGKGLKGAEAPVGLACP